MSIFSSLHIQVFIGTLTVCFRVYDTCIDVCTCILDPTACTCAFEKLEYSTVYMDVVY